MYTIITIYNLELLGLGVSLPWNLEVVEHGAGGVDGGGPAIFPGFVADEDTHHSSLPSRSVELFRVAPSTHGGEGRPMENEKKMQVSTPRQVWFGLVWLGLAWVG